MQPTIPTDSIRNVMAAERTFLAWIRTLISVVGFTIVVARFAIQSQSNPFFKRVSIATSVVVAFALLAYANIRYYDFVNSIHREKYNPDWYGPILISIVVGFPMIGIVVLAYSGKSTVEKKHLLVDTTRNSSKKIWENSFVEDIFLNDSNNHYERISSGRAKQRKNISPHGSPLENNSEVDKNLILTMI